jgi:DNA-binding NarL/FixJ family response regulator
VAEDSVILRDGLIGLLNRRGCVAEGVGDSAELLAHLAALYSRAISGESNLPDVLVIDIRMPPTFTDEGLRAAKIIRKTYPGLPLLLFSQYVEARYATELLSGDTKGIGYLLKDRVADVGEFVASLHRVANGETVLDPEVVSQCVPQWPMLN